MSEHDKIGDRGLSLDFVQGSLESCHVHVRGAKKVESMFGDGVARRADFCSAAFLEVQDEPGYTAANARVPTTDLSLIELPRALAT